MSALTRVVCSNYSTLVLQDVRQHPIRLPCASIRCMTVRSRVYSMTSVAFPATWRQRLGWKWGTVSQLTSTPLGFFFGKSARTKSHSTKLNRWINFTSCLREGNSAEIDQVLATILRDTMKSCCSVSAADRPDMRYVKTVLSAYARDASTQQTNGKGNLLNSSSIIAARRFTG